MPQFFHNKDTFMLNHFENTLASEVRPYGNLLSYTGSNVACTYQTGYFGNALGITGIAGGTGNACTVDYYASTDGVTYDDFDLDRDRRMHVDFWLNMPVINSGGWNPIVHYYSQNDGVHQIGFDFAVSDAGGGFGQPTLNLYSNTFSYTTFFPVITQNTWNHFAFERVSDILFCGHLNGVIRITQGIDSSCLFSLPNAAKGNGTGLEFGMYGGTGQNYATNSFLIDEFRCSNGNKYGGNTFTVPTYAYTE